MNSDLTYAQIADDLQSRYSLTPYEETVKWGKFCHPSRNEMTIYATEQLLNRGYPKSHLIHVFTQFNVNLESNSVEGKLCSQVSTFVAHNVTVKRSTKNNTNSKVYKTPKVSKVNYLDNLDNSEYAKAKWLEHKIKEGETNSKKNKGESGRGGAFSYGPQALRTELKERFIEFASKHLPDYCPITGCKLDYGMYPKSRGYDDTNKEHQKHRASLDRHDPTIGYTFDNSRVLSKLGNTLKGNATKEDIENVYRYMIRMEDK